MTAYRRPCARLRCALAATALLLSACDRTALPGPLAFPFAQSYAAARGAAPVLLENTLWWRQLEDPVLDRLIDRALARNLTLAAARDRVAAARAAIETIGPEAQVSGAAGLRAEGTGSDGPRINTTGRLGLDWMFDPWGARRAELRAAAARARAARAEEDAAHLLVLFNLADTYADLRYRQQLLQLAEQDLAGARRTERMLRDLDRAGEATRLEITRAAARTAGLQSSLPGLAADVAARANALGVLAGSAPGGLDPALDRALRSPRQPPRARMAPDTGIPADLLRNRPDIVILEARYAEALADIAIADAARYPALSLSGLISIETRGTDAGRPQYYLGPALDLPALPLKAGRARVAQRHALARALHHDWQETVLSAILEVENALIDYAAVARALHAARRSVQLYEETERLTRAVLARGEATVTDLITTQQNLAAARRTLADLQLRQLRGFVEINIGLGAGHGVRAP